MYITFGLSGCLNQVSPYNKKDEVSKINIGEAIQILSQMESECQKGNQEACSAMLGASAELASSEDKEAYEIGMQILQKACDMNLGQGCYVLGMFSMADFNGSIQRQNLGVSLKYLNKACTLDISEACQNMGHAYRQGEGVKKDYQKAMEYYKKDCDIALFKLKENKQKTMEEYSSWTKMPCMNAAKIHYRGEGVPKNHIKALEYFTKGCEISAFSCSVMAGQFYRGNIITQDYVMAFKLAKLGCEGNNAEGCNYLGIMYANGEGIKQDYQKAYKLFYNVCRNGGLDGTLYGRATEKELACYNLGLMYVNGNGVKQSYAQALSYFQQACNDDFSQEQLRFNKMFGGDVAPACHNIGLAYANGQGVRQSYKNALPYFAKGCDLGEQRACDAYREMKLSPALYGLNPSDF